MNLKEQQAKAWRLAPEDADLIEQFETGSWFYQTRGKDCWTKLCDGQNNGWDWHDTLQSREEWEVMNKQDEKWMPEVGQKCGYWSLDTKTEGIYCGKTVSGRYIVENATKRDCIFTVSEVFPIQPPADKYREEQIDKMAGLCSHIESGLITPREQAASMYKNGVRVLAPDEFVASRLADEEKGLLIDDFLDSGCTCSVDEGVLIIDAVQNSMIGDREK